MSPSDAVKFLETTEYGSLEGFCAFVLNDYPGFTKAGVEDPMAKASRTNLPVDVSNALYNSTTVQTTLSRMMASRKMDLEVQEAHIDKVIEIAKGTATGVRLKANDVLVAGRHLHALRGTPLHEEGSRSGLVINIQTGPRLAIEEANFQLPGGLPPSAIEGRRHGQIASLTSGEVTNNTDLSTLLSFYGEEEELIEGA
jgi:hypothetical protein